MVRIIGDLAERKIAEHKIHTHTVHELSFLSRTFQLHLIVCMRDCGVHQDGLDPKEDKQDASKNVVKGKVASKP